MTDHKRQPPWPTETDACPLPADHPWTAQEHWAWARILRGQIADMSRFPGPRAAAADFDAWLAGTDDEAGRDANEDDGAGALKPWPDHRILSAAFLHLILFQEPWASATVEPRVRIACARIEDLLRWSAQHYPGELWLDRSRIAAPVFWSGLHIGGSLSLDGARLEHGLGADRLKTGGGFFATAGMVALREVRLLGAIIGGNLELNDARFAEAFNGDLMHIEGSLFCGDIACAGEFRLLGAIIKGSASFKGATLAATETNALSADSMQLDGTLFLRDQFVASGNVNVSGAKIRGNVEVDNATFERGFDLDRTVVEGTFLCGAGTAAKGEVRMLGAKVAGSIAFIGAQLEGGLSADGLECGDLLCRQAFSIAGDLRLLGAHIAGDVDFTNAHLKGDLLADNLTVSGNVFLRGGFAADAGLVFIAANIAGNIRLDGVLEGVLDLTGARVTGELEVGKSMWGPDARLVLTNARLGALAASPGSFPQAVRGKPAPMDLTGLTYERIGGLNARSDGSLATAAVGDLKKWLTAGHERNEFTPGPYRTLANALVDAGEARKANHVLYAMRKQEHACETNILRWLGYFLSDLFIGYGHRSWRGIVWFLFLVIGFTGYGLWLQGYTAPLPDTAGLANVARWLGFSLGNAIPLIVLDKAHETFLAATLTKSQDPALVPVHIAWAFYAQKLLGFVVLSYLAAGLSGLATRQRE